MPPVALSEQAVSAEVGAVRLVGFGVTQGDDSVAATLGVRRQVEVPWRRADEALLEVGDENVGACNADSGGPILASTTEGGPDVLVGVISYGHTHCAGSGRASDIAASADFIASNLAKVSTARADAGGCQYHPPVVVARNAFAGGTRMTSGLAIY